METVGLSAMIKWLKDVPVEFWASFPKRSVQDFINMAVKGIMSGVSCNTFIFLLLFHLHIDVHTYSYTFLDKIMEKLYHLLNAQ